MQNFYIDNTLKIKLYIYRIVYNTSEHTVAMSKNGN